MMWYISLLVSGPCRLQTTLTHEDACIRRHRPL